MWYRSPTNWQLKNIRNVNKNMNLSSCRWANEKDSYLCWLSQWFHDASLRNWQLKNIRNFKKIRIRLLVVEQTKNKVHILLTFTTAPRYKFNTGHLRSDNWKTLGTSTTIWNFPLLEDLLRRRRSTAYGYAVTAYKLRCNNVNYAVAVYGYAVTSKR